MNLAPSHRPLTTLAALLVSFALAASAFGYGNQNKQQQQNRNNQQNNNNNNQPPPPKVTIPPVDMTALNTAKKELAATKAEEKKALNALNQVRSKLTKGFDTNPEVVEATKAVATAKTSYDAAAAPVIKSVETSAAYKSSLAAAGKADAEVASLRGKTDASPKARMDAAKHALDARNAVTQQREQALAGDEKASAAKKQLDEATAKLNKVRQELEGTIEDNTELAAAKQALEDAKAKTKSAEEQVATAQKQVGEQKAQQQQAIEQQKQAQREYQAQQRANKNNNKKKW